ncbi:DUF397 domain-containing protein [Labedaea rhizosphaerae]|uniref:Uncharacterized protein DUF397 n=1 Tax=Labedaea rhizosphaerae TaxID=598644 RepID=A0A4R6SIE7_LABRH|nr:DUF397 domain-containing protein [Labedaea rhizosphaerae]TDQ01166.1 uncharacterized protein DUF397 [Labedaea rhizosphaerae]
MTEWRKSSYSGGNGSDCVEVAISPRRAAVRDSKNISGPVLRFPAEAWWAFVLHRR